MAKDIQHLLMCLFAICISFWMKCLLSFAHFPFGLFDLLLLLLLSCESSLDCLDIGSLSGMWFENILFQSATCLFILLMEFFMEQKFLILMKINLSVFMDCDFGVNSRNILPSPRPQRFCLKLLPRSFILLCLHVSL